MIELYQFPPMYGIPNASPFCMKLESYLKAQNIDYETHNTVDLKKSPTEKMPYIKLNGQYYSDSCKIINMLEADSPSPMQEGMTELQHSLTLAYARLCEEHLYWVLVYSRWIDDDSRNSWYDDLASGIKVPGFVFKLVYKSLVRNARKQLEGQGLGRHKKDAIYHFADADLHAISIFLAGKNYFFNDRASLLDHIVYAVMTSIFSTPWDCVLKQKALQYPNLLAHTERMLKQLFDITLDARYT
ncbi:MAG: glutathione S-transferase family protein [Francisellaceae bacterium]